MEINPLDSSYIPGDLKALDQWVVWRLETRNGKNTKVPYIPQHPRKRASTTDPLTWDNFDKALQVYESDSTLDGIGFVFAKDDPYMGIDLDKCRDPQTGILELWAQEIVDALVSYTEISPSRTGLHIILQGTIPGPRNRDEQVEMYEHGRYFCMTGNHLPGTPTSIELRQSRLAKVYQKIFGLEEIPSALANSNGDKREEKPLPLNDQEILRKAMNATNGAEFSRLWNGEMGLHPSQSEADLDLCNRLYFWCGGDGVHIDRMFRKSGLYRPKWDEQHGEKTYGAMTIDKVLASGGKYYSWNGTHNHTVPGQFNEPIQESSPCETRRLELIRADLIVMEQTDWLWEGRIPHCALTAVVGDPDVGKTMLCLDLGAKGTIGTLSGFSMDTPFDVLIASVEDSPSHTLKPRLTAAGADLSKVHFIKMKMGDDDGGGLNLPDDLPLLAEEIKRLNAKLLIIDPLMSHLGDGLNANKDQDIRKALAPLATLAKEAEITIIVICHLNKNESASSKYRIGGSVGIFAVPRSVLLAGENPDNEDEFVLVHLKCNVGEKVEALRYRIQEQLVKRDDGETIKTGVVVWGGQAEGVTAESVLHNSKDPERKTDLQEAKEWLESYLGDGLALSAAESIKRADKDGIKEWTLQRARREMGVITKRDGFGKEASYTWRLESKKTPAMDDKAPSIDSISKATCNPCENTRKIKPISNNLSMDCNKPDICNPCDDHCNPCEPEEEIVSDDY